MRVESYRAGDKIQYKTGSPALDGIPHNSQATVVSTNSRENLLTVRFDAIREEVSYNPAQLRTQTRQSRVFHEETREVAQGERIRFTRNDKEMGVRFGEIGTVTRIGHDHSMTVEMDSGKTTEVSPKTVPYIDYGYAVDGPKDARAELVIATGDGLAQEAFQAASSKANLALHINAPQQDFLPAKEITGPSLAQSAKQEHDFGIGF
jgi:hypothetical protein